MSDTQPRINEIKTFIELIDKTRSPAEFSILCVLNGIPEFATQKFFNETIFALLSADLHTLHKEQLKLGLELRSRINQLDILYKDLLPE